MNLSMDDQITIQSADATEFSLPVAGIGSRSYAFIIDWHIRVVIALAWVLVMFVILYFSPEENIGLFTDSFWSSLAFIPAAIIYFLYHPVLEVTMQGRTPGKRMAGVRIVALDGRTPTTGALLIRNIFRLVDSLPSLYMVGMAVCLFSKNAVRIGDMAAGTLLVFENKTSADDFEQFDELAQNEQYAPEQLEVLRSLLERWESMEAPSRVRLAEQILKKMDVPLPEQTAAHKYGNSLHERLQAVQQGEQF